MTPTRTHHTDSPDAAGDVHERDLLRAVRSGNLAAFKEIYDAHAGLVYSVAYRMLRDRHHAEDVTQEVFLEAYRSLDTFRGESRLSTWLYRIAVNRSLNHQRKQKLQRWLSLDFEDTSGETAGQHVQGEPEDGPDTLMEKKDTERIVEDAINRLPERQRTAIVLHRYEGLSHEAIAEVLGVTIGSVESLLHRAKQSLARRLLAVKDGL
jgi:RNA polymerase sigma-70 factor (ECF subfamily)